MVRTVEFLARSKIGLPRDRRPSSRRTNAAVRCYHAQNRQPSQSGQAVESWSEATSLCGVRAGPWRLARAAGSATTRSRDQRSTRSVHSEYDAPLHVRSRVHAPRSPSLPHRCSLEHPATRASVRCEAGGCHPVRSIAHDQNGRRAPSVMHCFVVRSPSRP
jgi:hypothetical protein